MHKVRYDYEETVTLRRNFTVETTLDDKEMKKVLEEAETKAETFDDLMYEINKHPNVRIVDHSMPDYLSPDSSNYNLRIEKNWSWV